MKPIIVEENEKLIAEAKLELSAMQITLLQCEKLNSTRIKEYADQLENQIARYKFMVGKITANIQELEE